MLLTFAVVDYILFRLYISAFGPVQDQIYLSAFGWVLVIPLAILICIGLSIIIIQIILIFTNVKGKVNWFKIIKPAGTSTLTCYLIPYYQEALFLIFGIHYWHIFNYGAGGVIRSFATCFIVIFITGFLEKRRLRLKV